MSASLTRALYLVASVLFVAATLGSCTTPHEYGDDDDDDGSGGTGGTGGTEPVPSFSLTVDSSQTRDTIATFQASGGNTYVVLGLTLSNQSVPANLPMDLIYFSLRTANSLVLNASPVSAALDQPCRADLSVAQGGTASCSLAFETPNTETPSELLYDDYAGHATSAPVPAPVLTPCVAAEMMSPGWETPSCQDCLNAATQCSDAQHAYIDAILTPGGFCYSDAECYIPCAGTGLECA